MWPLLVSLLVGGVEVAPGTPCVDARSAERLAAQVPADVTVSLGQASPAVLVVVLSSPGRTSLRREVPASAPECDAVERVVLALVRSWLSTPVVSPRVVRGGSDAAMPNGVSGSDAGARDALIRTSGADAGGSSGARDSLRTSGSDAGVPSGVNGPDSPVRDSLKTSGSNAGASGLDAGSRDALNRTSGSQAGVSGSSAGARDALGTSGSDAGEPSGLSGFDAGVSAGARDSLRMSGSDARVQDAQSRRTSGFDAGELSGVNGRDAARDSLKTSGSDASVRDALSRRTSGVDAGESSRSDAMRTIESEAGVRDEMDRTPGGVDASVGSVDGGTSEVRVGLSVLGGVSSGTTPDVLPQGLLSFDLVWRWLGVALDVGLSGGVKQSVAPGEIVASWQWLSLSGRAVWSPTERLLLDVQLGARAHRLVASATGFTMNEPAQTLFSVGGVGSLGASLRLLGPFGVTVRATGVLKPPERFVITNVSQALDFGSLEGAVHAGLFARW